MHACLPYNLPTLVMVIADLLEHVDGLLGKKEDLKLKNLLMRHSHTDIALVLDRLSHGKRKTFALLPPEIQAEVALLTTENTRAFILPRLSDHALARFLHFNNEDDAADLLHELPAERRSLILRHIKDEKRVKIEKLLKFSPETAGGLMDLNFITVSEDETIKAVSDKVRQHVQAHKQAPIVIVLDNHDHLLGFVPYRTLMFNVPVKPVGDFLTPLTVTSSKTDQEKVLKMATQNKADLIGVVDEGQFLGVIHLHDLLRVAQMEATEDFYLFAGVNKEEELSDSALAAVKFRYVWLIINLATAFLAAFVVSLFETTIAKTAILAAYMPIVAGMGGNAGTQTLAVVVRGLALGEGTRRKGWWWRVISKEAVAGLINGLINGLIVAAVVFVFKGTVEIGIILLLSMVINLVIAGVFGAIVPLALKAMKVDPAISATVFVTTATDVFGFLAFLGLASVFIR